MVSAADATRRDRSSSRRSGFRSSRRNDRSRSSGQCSRSISLSRQHDHVVSEERGMKLLSESQVAEAALPRKSQQRLQRMRKEGLITENCFDMKSLISLGTLSECSQETVFDYLDQEKRYLAGARAKSGFLQSATEKARAGFLDYRGMGGADPWRHHLLAIAKPKCPSINLVPESQWISQTSNMPVKLLIDVSADAALDVTNLSITILPTRSVFELKQRLLIIGVGIKINKMKLKEPTLGFLKDDKTIASYNISFGTQLVLARRNRAGLHLKKDHSL